MTEAEEIAVDESRNWVERIRATAELIYQGKRGNEMRCKMPGCEKIATESWMLVDVCCHCRDALQAESQRYYAKRISSSERVLHQQILKIKEGKR